MPSKERTTLFRVIEMLNDLYCTGDLTDEQQAVILETIAKLSKLRSKKV